VKLQNRFVSTYVILTLLHLSVFMYLSALNHQSNFFWIHVILVMLNHHLNLVI